MLLTFSGQGTDRSQVSHGSTLVRSFLVLNGSRHGFPGVAGDGE